MRASVKKMAEELADKVCSIGYEAELNPHLSGAKDALQYRSEFMCEVYNPLIDFEEDVEFVTWAQIQKLTSKLPLYFDGQFVKIVRETDFCGYKYYVYCASVSKLGICYKRAKESGFKNF